MITVKNTPKGKVYRIPVGTLTEKQVRERLRELMKGYNEELDLSIWVRRDRRLKMDKILKRHGKL